MDATKTQPVIDGQPPRFGQVVHVEAERAGDFTAAPKTEKFFATFADPHFGHGGGGAECERARCSNVSAHDSQVYS